MGHEELSMNDDASQSLQAPATVAEPEDAAADWIGYEAADPSLMAALWGDEPPKQGWSR